MCYFMSVSVLTAFWTLLMSCSMYFLISLCSVVFAALFRLSMYFFNAVFMMSLFKSIAVFMVMYSCVFLTGCGQFKYSTSFKERKSNALCHATPVQSGTSCGDTSIEFRSFPWR
ncbi:hypothetical protein [robinz microvirus RP_110]|nr:hypothetical protein [robinz microvirus RP_110]